MHILSFQPEKILYFYMAACIAVLLFNILYIFIDKYSGTRLEKNSLELLDGIMEQCRRIEEAQRVDPEYLEKMKKAMNKLSGLKAFEQSMDAAFVNVSGEIAETYIVEMRSVFLYLTAVYERRDDIEKAYFASIVEKFGVDRGQNGYDGVIEFLLKMVVSRNVYVRENALRALYSVGSSDAVLSAWDKMEDNAVAHSTKLLADGLLRFTGDKQELAHILWGNRDRFSARRILPVMQFIRFSGFDFRDEFLELLDKDSADKELRLEAIRYFRKCPCREGGELLRRFLEYQAFIDWEYAAMAALALAEYPGGETVECLKNGLGASNWYVRLNCAEALIYGLQVPQMQLFDVYNGNDRYAREILQYVYERAEIKEQEMELMAEHV